MHYEVIGRPISVLDFFFHFSTSPIAPSDTRQPIFRERFLEVAVSAGVILCGSQCLQVSFGDVHPKTPIFLLANR
jgi:hypothetical protein